MIQTLVPIDSQPLKKSEQKKCQLVLERMQLARATLRRFKDISQPAFTQWLHLTFGKDMTELRELEAENLAILGLKTKIERSKDNVRGYPKGVPLEHSRIKELYRALARKLHPDTNSDIDQKQRELWFDVQAAYETKDIERLEVLSAMSDLYDDSLNSIENVWALISLQGTLLSGLRQLQMEINILKVSPAWNFEIVSLVPVSLAKIRIATARKLADGLESLHAALAWNQSLIENWKNSLSASKSKHNSRLSRSRGKTSE